MSYQTSRYYVHYVYSVLKLEVFHDKLLLQLVRCRQDCNLLLYIRTHTCTVHHYQSESRHSNNLHSCGRPTNHKGKWCTYYYTQLPSILLSNHCYFNSLHIHDIVQAYQQDMFAYVGLLHDILHCGCGPPVCQ